MTSTTILLPEWEAFERDYVKSGIPHLYVVRSLPAVALFVDQGAGRIGARFQQAAAHASSQAIALSEIHVDDITRDGTQHLEIWTDARNLFPNFYRLAAEIVAAVVEGGAEPEIALAGAVSRWEALLSRPSLMSDESQTGLAGELWLLDRLIAVSGNEALDSWVGPAGQAHDFRLGDIELEVKTTSGSTRVHMINGLGQLLPSIDCTLFLLSLKMTNAGSGGRSLPEAVAAIAKALSASSSAVLSFRAALAKAGYDESDAHLYPRRRRLRDAAMLIPVVDGVPRLTPDAISEIPVRFVTERISRIAYSIDVEGLGFADGTPPFLSVIPLAEPGAS